ncbi:hypothetical protein HDE_11139 [Halotydeus destructor]|nr:hypothetical protein HDE_11139 [Halotydeus destructor]
MYGKILNASYPAQNTDTSAGMNEAYQQLLSTPSRNGVSKIMMVFTDGVANVGADVATTSRLAVDYDITNIAVGIGSSTSRDELLHIAGQDSGRVYEVESYQALLEAHTYFSGVVCSVAARPALGSSVLATIPARGKQFYEYEIPEGGATFDLSVTAGSVHGYYSFSEPKPSSAIHDGKINGKTYIKQNGSLELFLTIEGTSVVNAYSLTAHAGEQVMLQVIHVTTFLSVLSVAVAVLVALFILYCCRLRWSRSYV